MAVLRKRVSTQPTPNGETFLDVEYDDVAMRLTGFWVKNDGPDKVKYVIVRDTDGKQWGQTFDPIPETRFDIGTGAANRVDLVLNSRGGFDGYGVGRVYPVA